MKKLIISAVVLLMNQLMIAQAPTGKAKPGTIYGATVENSNALEAQKLPGMLT